MLRSGSPGVEPLYTLGENGLEDDEEKRLFLAGGSQLLPENSCNRRLASSPSMGTNNRFRRRK